MKFKTALLLATLSCASASGPVDLNGEENDTPGAPVSQVGKDISNTQREIVPNSIHGIVPNSTHEIGKVFTAEIDTKEGQDLTETQSIDSSEETPRDNVPEEQGNKGSSALQPKNIGHNVSVAKKGVIIFFGLFMVAAIFFWISEAFSYQKPQRTRSLSPKTREVLEVVVETGFKLLLETLHNRSTANTSVYHRNWPRIGNETALLTNYSK